MGWNSWYTWYHTITGKKMREAADQMVASGMADAGYMYVNVDDCWMMQSPEGYEVRKSRLRGQDTKATVGKTRGPNGEFLANGNFPDMKALTDYLLIGYVGVPPAAGFQEPKPTPLTPNEQYSYMSMWSLMAAPLFFSGDMARLDEFTLNVLCNPEVIDVDQDALGRQARPVRFDEQDLVLAKPMEDGSLALGLFNLAEFPRTITVSLEELGVETPQRVRDLWRHQDLGNFDRHFEAKVNRHGVALLRLYPVNP